jgi:succinate dehydrogenase/fumarate reductase cytochrome b subunit
MLVKLFLLLIVLSMLVTLGTGLVYLIKDAGRSERTLKTLMIRASFTVILLIILLVGIAMGWIVPHPL